eukprot:8496604-Pyramimonas_sp.AAC.1
MAPRCATGHARADVSVDAPQTPRTCRRIATRPLRGGRVGLQARNGVDFRNTASTGVSWELSVASWGLLWPP